MYRPSLLLPNDDYRGPLKTVGVVAAILPIEYAVFLITGILTTSFAYYNVNVPTWSFVLLPISLFDICLLTTALYRIYNNYSWLLRSERKSRLLDVIGLIARLISSSILISVFCGFLKLKWFVISCGFWYFSLFGLNIWAQSTYIWIRIHCCELLVFLVSLKTSLKLSGCISASWAVVLSPLMLFFSSILFLGYMLWHFARHEQTIEVDLALRSFVFGLIIMGVCYFSFLRILIVWLETYQGSALAWGVPLLFGQLLSLFYAGFIAIAYAAQHHAETLQMPSEASDSPRVFRNMLIRLDKVGNNFYRLDCQGSVGAPLIPALTSKVEDYGATEIVSAEPTEDATTTVDPCDDPENACIICYQNVCNAIFLHCGHGGMCFECAQTCMRRTGLCPTCRQKIAGVANFDPEEAKHNSRVTARIADMV